MYQISNTPADVASHEPKHCGSAIRESKPHLCVKMYAADGLISHVHLIDEQMKDLPKIMSRQWVKNHLDESTAMDGIVRVDVTFQLGGKK